MKLYIARDKEGELYLFSSKPERVRTHFGDFHTDKWEIDERQFPEVTWENSPQEVELKLCNTDFDRIIEENKDVLKRIKENGD